MRKIATVGGKRLTGEIKIQGSKNSSLPIMAAALLTEEKCTIHNVPDISDVRTFIDIMHLMGVEHRFENNTLEIKAYKPTGKVSFDKCRRFRASSLLMGVLLARFGAFELPLPGGCSIGKRPLDIHFDVFEQMGANIETTDCLKGACYKAKGIEYYFRYPSVGAMENAVILATLAEGTSILHNCAMEPEIVDLCNFLNSMGAQITGIGSRHVKIVGVDRLHGTELTVEGDRIVAGTYLAACSLCGGNIELHNIIPSRLPAEIEILRKTGSHIFTDNRNNAIIISSEHRPKAIPYIATGPFPEFSTDMQPSIMTLMAYSRGSSCISEKVFDNRKHTAMELIKMGATIECIEEEVYVNGRRRLHGTMLVASDLRDGAALVVAALGSREPSIICGCEHILRGYEDIVRDFNLVGADIRWIENIEE